MANEEQDYILRMLQELRQFVARVVRLRDRESVDEALLAVVHARERLFQRPGVNYASQAVDDQLALLAEGESPERAREKCLAYAAILKEAALVYQVRSEDDMAVSAFQLALYIHLVIALQFPESYEELRDPIGALLTRIPPERLFPPVQVLLKQLPP